MRHYGSLHATFSAHSKQITFNNLNMYICVVKMGYILPCTVVEPLYTHLYGLLLDPLRSHEKRAAVHMPAL